MHKVMKGSKKKQDNISIAATSKKMLTLSGEHIVPSLLLHQEKCQCSIFIKAKTHNQNLIKTKDINGNSI